MNIGYLLFPYDEYRKTLPEAMATAMPARTRGDYNNVPGHLIEGAGLHALIRNIYNDFQGKDIPVSEMTKILEAHRGTSILPKGYTPEDVIEAAKLLGVVRVSLDGKFLSVVKGNKI